MNYCIPSSNELVYDIPKRISIPSSQYNINNTHHKTIYCTDYAAWMTNKLIKFIFDLLSGLLFTDLIKIVFNKNRDDELKAIKRIIFLESIAPVPSSTAHFWRIRRSCLFHIADKGIIQQLHDEAENERIHLFIALQIYHPAILFRICLWIVLISFSFYYFIMYIIFPEYSHRLAGYMEEDAISTYSNMISDMDEGKFSGWKKIEAPLIAKLYYNLNDTATWKDVLICIRQDEIHHRDTQHSFANQQHTSIASRSTTD